VKQAVEFRLKRNDAPRCAENHHERPGNEGDQKMNLKNQPAHVSILRAN
jgi:hypothetical protein